MSHQQQLDQGGHDPIVTQEEVNNTPAHDEPLSLAKVGDSFESQLVVTTGTPQTPAPISPYQSVNGSSSSTTNAAAIASGSGGDQGASTTTPPAGAAAAAATHQSGKLFVGQVPAVCTEEMLFPVFQPYGSIVEIKIMRDAQGRSKGCAWVRYKSQGEAQAAIEALHEKHAVPPQTNMLQVRYAQVKSRPADSNGQSVQPHQHHHHSFHHQQHNVMIGYQQGASSHHHHHHHQHSSGYLVYPQGGAGGAPPRSTHHNHHGHFGHVQPPLPQQQGMPQLHQHHQQQQQPQPQQQQFQPYPFLAQPGGPTPGFHNMAPMIPQAGMQPGGVAPAGFVGAYGLPHQQQQQQQQQQQPQQHLMYGQAMTLAPQSSQQPQVSQHQQLHHHHQQHPAQASGLMHMHQSTGRQAPLIFLPGQQQQQPQQRH